jgi:hypothetical protein
MAVVEIVDEGSTVSNCINSTVVKVNTLCGNTYFLKNSKGLGWEYTTGNPNI